ncbi:MAG: helix-turn-helix transcriptional regulator [Desulfobacter sp.]|nr:helix-turn-helix transcriptional regulator [Desulfobacter sp.]WDP87040.1 MAG: helix-turn-helix transcriptional regulator [Desulfobacter sp.]
MNQTTRERIIKQAIVCIAQDGNAGLDDIARAANVGRATLYRHFKSRADLLTELKLSAGDQLKDAVGPVFDSQMSALEKLVRIVRLLVPLGASLNVSSYFKQSIKDEKNLLVRQGYEWHQKNARQLCLDLKKEGALAGDLPLSWLVASMNSLLFAAWEKVEAGDLAPKQAPWLVLTTFLTGHGTLKTQTWFTDLKEATQ